MRSNKNASAARRASSLFVSELKIQFVDSGAPQVAGVRIGTNGRSDKGQSNNDPEKEVSRPSRWRAKGSDAVCVGHLRIACRFFPVFRNLQAKKFLVDFWGNLSTQ